jgi:hypothetical protein
MVSHVKKTSIALGQKLTDKNIGPVIGILTEGFSDRPHKKHPDTT